jgi:transcriptional regulator with PAS, ATPase and Fis domain
MAFRERVNMFELQLVKEALAKQNNNQSRAAESLQLDRTVLRRILEREKS